MIVPVKKPYSVDKKKYMVIISASFVTLLGGCLLATKAGEDTFWIYVAEIVRNLSYGCIASAVVAWIIDWVNTRRENQKASAIYDSVYTDLFFGIKDYLSVWAETAMATIPVWITKTEWRLRTWDEWYQITRDNCLDGPGDTFEMVCCLLQPLADELWKETSQLKDNYSLLIVNGVMNEAIRYRVDRLNSDFRTMCGLLSLPRGETSDPQTSFWKLMDRINDDLHQDIEAWTDIREYNYIRFFSNLFEDQTEIQCARQEADGR